MTHNPFYGSPGNRAAIADAAQPINSFPVDPDEPTPSFEDVMATVGVELWPLPEFSHDQFMRDREQSSWLERLGQRLTEVRLEQAARDRERAALRDRPRDASGRFLPRGQRGSEAGCYS
jgi:hypothetical protein